MSTIAIGFMSGTSCDGVDAAILDTDGKSNISLLDGLTLPYEDDLRTRLLEASQHDVPIVELLRLEKDVSNHHLQAARLLLGTLHERLAPKLHGDFYVAAPARDMFLAISVEPSGFVQRIQKRVEQDYRRLPYPITSNLFVVTRDGVAGTVDRDAA